MVAAAIEIGSEPGEAPRPHLSVVADSAPAPMGELQAAARSAEVSLARSAVRGVLIGMPVCAVIWVGIVALGLAMAGGSWDLLPALGIGAVVGMFSGAFFGGWAGVTAAAEQLEEAERHIIQRH